MIDTRADAIGETAPAKINLALHVTGRRSDGYHLLDTLVVFTGAGDRIRVAPAAKDEFTVAGPFAAGVPADDANLVVRARDLLRRMAGARAFPVSIELEKNLPVASGIGGGSSDAAAALRALARLWDLALPADELAQAGLALGADMPMCVAARTLRAQGVGEEIAAVTGLPALDMVLVNPGVAVATPAVFGQLQSRHNPPLPALPALPAAAGFAALTGWLATTRNDLEAPAIAAAPQIAPVLAALRDSGAAFARMSGSGATCFGLYPSPEEAACAAERIAAAQPSWYVRATRTIEPPSGKDA